MAYNVFSQSSAEEALFYFMLKCNAFMPILFKLLLPKLKYMSDEKCRIHLDAMQEI